ncbi:ABC transporter permease [Aquimarina sp. 2201CG14-23]|uniref:ABC transporter permease n=1 Tax=Aquimarina mycalae TaxID=3040073 RepID=UPI0024782C41|nr:FtsX-like permease family protein [Aquimarina sp. 2201CG14-23]MDH7448141.1 ABC transporter permease [Aquimarina sp. 2201CG14-23]
MIWNYFKIAWRNLQKRKIFSFINIIGLTIGLSASFVIGLMVYYDYSFDTFHKDGDRIYRVVSDFYSPEGTFYNSGVTVALEDAIKENSNFEKVSGFYIERPTKVENKEKEIKIKWPKNVIFTDKDYFDIFQYKFLAGNKATALSSPNNVVLTQSRAADYFPELSADEIVGKTLVYNDSLHIKVTAIVENFKERTDFIFEEFVSSPTLLKTRVRGNFINKNWNSTNSSSQLFVKVNQNANFEKIQEEFDALAQKHLDEYSRNHGQSKKFRLQPLNDIHFNENYGIYDWEQAQASKPLLQNLALVALFLLLLGCINFINLNTAQATQRAKEIGIRKTLGSSKKQLIAQFMGETFLLVMFSAILSLILSQWLIDIFSDFVAEDLDFQLFGNPIIIIGIVILLILVTILSGFYPALILSKFNTITVLKNHLAVGEKKVGLRKFLTIFQFTIAQVFIIGTLLVGKQINYLLSKDMGFKTDAIVSVSNPRGEQQLEKKERYLQKLKGIPQIKKISLGGAPPASFSSNTTTTTYNNGEREIQSDLQFIFGDTDYSQLFELELLAGRTHRNDTIKELVINEAARKIYGFKTPEEAIGKVIDFGDFTVPIVGVMADFHQRSLKSEINPMALRGDWDRSSFSRFRAVHIAFQNPNIDDLQSTLSKIESTYGEVYKDIEDYRINFMDETVAKFYSREQKVSKLLNWATGLSILISCLGLLGLVIYTTNRRVKEIGVRKVLGASLLQINSLLCKEFLILVGIAFIVASPIAWYGINNWLQDFAYKTNISFWVFILSGFLMILFALLIISIKTLQAANANPINSLRTE